MNDIKLAEWCNELPKNAINYIKSVINLLENKIGCENIVSIILFGSLASSKKLTEVSDIDLIIILDDKISKNTISNLNQLIIKKEEEFKFRKKASSGIERFLHILESQTGMFLSHFICKKSHFLTANFSKIFNVNPIVSYLIAPKNIVLNNVFKSAKLLYGRDLLSKAKDIKISRLDLARSLIMNAFLSIGAIILYKFFDGATKFSMEGCKWSMLACYFYSNIKTAGVKDVVKYFEDKGVFKEYLERFIKLREDYRNDLKFSLLTPFIVFKIHLLVNK